MARTKVTRTQLSKFAFASVALVAADVTNKNYCDMTGYEILLAFNSGVTARAVTVNSGYVPQGRTKDIAAEAIAAGTLRAYGPFKFLQGWGQGGGSALNIEADNAEVFFAWLCPPFV